MTPEETLKELRLLEQPLPFWGKRDMEIAKSAADLIESLLSERADKDNHIAALAAELTDKNGQLKFHAEQLLDDVKRIDGLTARAEKAEAELKEAVECIGLCEINARDDSAIGVLYVIDDWLGARKEGKDG